MWNHRLARLKVELGAVQKDRNNVRFERDQAGNPTNFRIGFAIRPSRKPRVADVVVAAEAFVGTKGLMFHEGKSGLIDVGTRNVPARSKTGLVEDQRPLTVRDDAVAITNHEMARSLADVNSMVSRQHGPRSVPLPRRRHPWPAKQTRSAHQDRSQRRG